MSVFNLKSHFIAAALFSTMTANARPVIRLANLEISEIKGELHNG